jgi:hypothetical protein
LIMSNGILLVAYGEKYLRELEACQARIQAVWPGVALHVARGPEAHEPHMLHRLDAMIASPFERTMYVDVDSWLVEPVPELFELLDHFDIAMSHCDYRQVYPVRAPACFPEYNGGLIVWRRNERTGAFFADWRRRFLRDHATRYDEKKVSWFPSQPSLREALYHSGVRIATLPSEYHWTGIGYVQGKVKLVHKRPNAVGEAERINRNAGEQRVAIIWNEPIVMRW